MSEEDTEEPFPKGGSEVREPRGRAWQWFLVNYAVCIPTFKNVHVLYFTYNFKVCPEERDRLSAGEEVGMRDLKDRQSEKCFVLWDLLVYSVRGDCIEAAPPFLVPQL